MATNNENLDPGEELEEFSLLLTTFPHVVAVILSYMNAKELNLYSRVCTLWSKVAKNLKKHRRTRAWTFLTNKDVEGQCSAEVKDFICNLYTEPRTVFMFCQSDFYETADIPCETPDIYGGFGDFVKCCLPKDCTLIGICSGGVVGTTSDMKQIFEVEEEEGVAILCLPDYDGFDVVSRFVDETDEVFGSRATDLLPIQDPNDCKAVLTFISSPGITRRIGMDLMDRFSSALVAGGFVDDIIPNDMEVFKLYQCAALCGDNVKVASVIIHSEIQNAGQVEEIVKKLKSHNLNETKSFAFMFACVGRGVGLYGDHNVESSIFKKYFPNTPLLGFFGNGEIGFSFVSGMDRKNVEAPQKKKRKSESGQKLFHAYTTVLVLVSIS